MKYRIALHKSEEGYRVSVPGFPGCEYLSVVEEQFHGEEIRETEVPG